MKISVLFVAMTVCIASTSSVLGNYVGAASAQTRAEAEKTAEAKLLGRSLYYCVGGDTNDYNQKNIDGKEILELTAGVAALVSGALLLSSGVGSAAGAAIEGAVLSKAATLLISSTAYSLVGSGTVKTFKEFKEIKEEIEDNGGSIADVISREFEVSEITKGNWFGSLVGGRKSSAGAYVAKNLKGDATTTGADGDDVIHCDYHTSTITATTAQRISELRQMKGESTISVDDLACGNGGIFDIFALSEEGEGSYRVNDKNSSCSEIMERNATSKDGLGFRLNNKRTENIKKTLTDYIGSSIEDFTDLELYYVYNLSFRAECTTNSRVLGGAEWKNESNKETRYYKLKYEDNEVHFMQNMDLNPEKENKNFLTILPNKTTTSEPLTCKDVEDYLEGDNKITQAYKSAKEAEDAAGIVYAPGSSEGRVETEEEISDKSNDDACSNVSGISWLLCPVLELLSSVVTGMYDTMIEPLLYLQPLMFSSRADEQSTSIMAAWEIFRNIANIVLAIFLLIVIFSQLTGFGIDNYGIKKALPKLVISAVLINMSFIISQSAVDISNILGSSMNGIFDSFSQRLGSYEGGSADTSVAVGVDTGLTYIGIGVGKNIVKKAVDGIAVKPFLKAIGKKALLAILPAAIITLLAALIAIIVFFILLGMRQAGVILLVVISPIAFACYILPNTKTLFNKWKKALTSLLMMYPLAGMLIGGGGFASSVLLKVSDKSDSAWLNMIALLAAVLPFFFLPSLLRSSFAALGNIGNKFSGWSRQKGRQVGGFTSRQVANSSTYKNAVSRTKSSIASQRAQIVGSKLDKKVRAGYQDGKNHKDYHKEDGTKANTYKEMSAEDKKKFAKNNTDFRTQNQLLRQAEYQQIQNDYEKGLTIGAFATEDQTRAKNEKLWGDAAISANTNALNNETYFETDEKEFTDDDGNSLGTYKYDYETNQWRKKLDGGKLGEALDTDRIVTDKDGQKWKTDKEGTLRKVKEDGSLGEAYKRKTFKGSDGRDYHFQDKQMVDEDGKELADGVTITDENGMKFQKAGVDAEGYAQYKPVDFKPDATLDKDATYKYDGHDCHFEGDKLFYEDDEGKKVEVGEGAEVVSASGKNAGYSYKMGKNGLEFTKSKDIVTKDGKRIAFYAGKNGKFELHDVDQYNANSGRMKELEGKLELAREKLDHLPDGQARMEAGREVAALGTELDNLRASTALGDGTELGIGDVSFKYNRTSGTLAAFNGTLKDDTAGFTYNGQALRLGSNGIFKTESGLEMKSINPGMPAIFRDDGSGVFKDIETGDVAKSEQVAKAQAENKIKSYNDLRVMQARGSDAMQVGNMVGMLGANMDNYTRNAVLGAQNKTINQINNTIGEGVAIRKAHSDGIETTTASLATTQNIRKQFEATTGGNIAARERTDTFKINQFDDNDIYNKATGTNALADLTAIANSTTERAGKRELARTMISSGMYNGGRAYDTADKARKFINTFKNAYDLGGERGEFTQEEIASIERLTPQQRHEVEDVLAGRSNAYDFLQNENVTDGQKLYLRQIWGGDTSVVNRGNPVSIFSSDPSVQAYREAMMSAASAGRKVSAEAVIGKTTTQSNQAVDAAAIKNKNQFNQELATNAVGEVELNMDVLTRQAENEYNLKAAKNNIDITPVISASYAQNLEKQRFDIAQEKMYDEGFKLLPKGDLMNLLNGLSTSPFSSDSNYLRSLLKNAQIKCGDDDVAKFVKANQGTMNAAQRVVFDEFFAASRDPLFKAYSKIVGACKEAGVATINLPTFEQWCTGTAIIPAAAAASKPNYVSMAAYVSSQDEKALAEAEKSSIKIAFSDPNYTRNYSDRQLVYGLIHNKNQEAGIALREGINGFGSTKRAALIDQIQNGEISSITENAMSTLIGQNISGITTKSQITDPSILSAVDHLALSYNNLSPQMKDRIPNYLVRLFKLFYP